MNSTDVTRLQNALGDLLKQLERFDTGLEDGFSTLDVAWKRLDDVWDGHAYSDFVTSWDEVRQMMRQYNEISVRYENFLRERIVALGNFERSM
ncbi:MAG: hypothetical protein KC546_14680 [Anaerolineae bacterium]|nr:hypothetical protein [Anaerolineae bacterium]MCA9889621.1 hypothetical protein [Anaerolineae bacterium]MCA9892968.1 hypothetical protein [Anaerolineae bacterium]MCB9461192.1 hypothetical protein [Anaerolineaceae bacterium]